MEVGYKSIWWARCNHVCDRFGLSELVNLLWFNNIINKEGMAMLGMRLGRLGTDEPRGPMRHPSYTSRLVSMDIYQLSK